MKHSSFQNVIMTLLAYPVVGFDTPTLLHVANKRGYQSLTSNTWGRRNKIPCLHSSQNSSCISGSFSLQQQELDESSSFTSFWSQTRTTEEIRRHASATLFPDEAYIRTRQRIKVISTDLPLITIDEFLSKEMCEQIIDVAKASNQMKQSTMGVFQEVSSSRTSSTLWLHENECEVPLRILAGKVSRLMELNASHMENL